MNELKVENWNGYEIRFLLVDGKWWAVAADVVNALGLNQVTRALKGLQQDGVTTSKVIDSLGRYQEVNIINEKNVYKLAFKSRKKEAEEFQDWVYEMLKSMRERSGLEGFQVFLMMDKEHQKQMMNGVGQIKQVEKKHFIKANTVANKVTSTIHGYPKMVKKGDMTPEMLKARQPILEDTVELMRVKDEYKLDISVSESVKSKWVQ